MQSVDFENPEEVRLIVKFKSPPLSALSDMHRSLKIPQLRKAQAAIQTEHSQFKSDIDQIDASYRALNTAKKFSIKTQIRLTYRTAFNGVALSTKRWIGEEIQKLPYVAQVSEDAEVEAFDDASNTIIGAPLVWSKYNVHGEGTDISIIDTGIDYFHPALGNAPFPNSKVVGGYDFGDEDSDPMDNNGHGTHVAGIAAGNSVVLKGVAFKARLWAFKVFNNQGIGYNSSVIAGIEKSMDPDEDPLTPTPIDVINLSIGNISGNPKDPVSQAVNNATNSGIVCVAAAGNWGPYYSTIISPGCARGALTVGASTPTDGIADFSSRGPDWYSLGEKSGIKPDIVAPGVEIKSAMLGGGYIVSSGTSMATPHVTGAAAIMKQLHPDWTGDQIKAVLMESAHDIGQDVWTQGSGRISLSDAASRKIIIEPPSVHFGVDDVSQTLWTTTATLRFTNTSEYPEIFNLNIEEGEMLSRISRAYSITFSPQNVTIPAKGTVSVSVVLAIDNPICFFSDGPDWFYGNIVATSSGTHPIIKLPFSFLKNHMLRVIAEESPWWLYVSKSLICDFYWPIPNDTFNIITTGFRGPVDIVGTFWDRKTKIVKSDIPVYGINTVHIEKSDSKNKITLRCLDHLGRDISKSSKISTQSVFKKGNYAYTLYCGRFFEDYPTDTSGTTFDTLYLPDLDSRYSIQSAYQILPNDSSLYVIPFSVDSGIHSSMILENDPRRFKPIDYTYRSLDYANNIYLTTCGGIKSDDGSIFWLPPGTMNISYPFTLKGYYNLPPPQTHHTLFTTQLSHHRVWWPWCEEPYIESVTMHMISPDTVQFFQYINFRDTLPFSYTAIPLKIKLGYGIVYWSGKFENNINSIKCQSPFNAYCGGRYFTNPRWQILPSGRPYKLFHGTTVCDSGWLINDSPKIVSPGNYSLEICDTNYKIVDISGKATVKLNFDTRRQDPNPPYINNLRIVQRGNLTEDIFYRDSTYIELEVGDDNGIESTWVLFQSLGEDHWMRGSVTLQGNSFIIDDLPDLPTGYTSMRLNIVDRSGNLLDFKLEPAFFFYSFPPLPPMLVSADNGETSQPIPTQFQWQRSCGAATYRLQVATDSLFSRMVMDDSTITNAAYIFAGLQHDTWYYWRVNAHNVLGTSQFSEVRKFKTILESPEQFGATGSFASVNLQWSPITGAENYQLQLSTNSTFSAITKDDSTITDTSITLDSLSKPVRYYWRVRALNKDGVSKWSSTNYFDVVDKQLIKRYTYPKGWNLISVPLSINNPSTDFLFLNACSQASKYLDKYIRTDSILTGIGYWLKFPAIPRISREIRTKNVSPTRTRIRINSSNNKARTSRSRTNKSSRTSSSSSKQQAQQNQKQDSSQQQQADQQKKQEEQQQAAKQSEQQKQDQQQAQQQTGQPKDKSDEKEQEAAAAQALAQMTPEQAQQLLDAQKGEEQMLPPKATGKPADRSRPIKDW